MRRRPTVHLVNDAWYDVGFAACGVDTLEFVGVPRLPHTEDERRTSCLNCLRAWFSQIQQEIA